VIVAIDGPAGAGKSTVARKLAERLGFHYLDTGAMYRAVAWLASGRELPLEDGPALAGLAREHPVSFDDAGRVWIAGADVTAAIRKPEIDRLVPLVARQQELRAVLRERQRELGRQGNAVIEGRDIGTVVAPDAELKVFLTASARERARRRAEQLGADVEEVLREQLERDRRDETREHSPLQAARDALRVDTDGLGVDEVVQKIVRLATAVR
jgi:cytidylate kinase